MLATFINKDGSYPTLPTNDRRRSNISKCTAGIPHSIMAWCRECAIGRLSACYNDLPDFGRDVLVNIYGVRWRDKADYQPAGVLKIEKRITSMTIAFNCWVTGIARAVGASMQEVTIQSYQESVSTAKLPKISLNTERTRKVSSIVPAATTMLGSWERLPAFWLQSPAVMSLLLQLPRLWGAVAEHKEYWQIFKGRGGGLKSVDYLKWGKWGKWANSMMHPTWVFMARPVHFWTFLAVLAITSQAPVNTPTRQQLSRDLLDARVSGYVDWVNRHVVRQNKYPICAEIFNNLQKSGPTAFVTLPIIEAY